MATGSQADVNLEGESTFMKLLGLNFEEMGPERVVASLETGPDYHEGSTLEEPAELLVGHFFNHQAHHRGQLHDVLTQKEASPPVVNSHGLIRP